MEIKVFGKDGIGAVRVLEKDGESWWIAKDVCDVLSVGNVSESLKNIDDDEKSTISNTESRNGGGKISIIKTTGQGIPRLQSWVS